MSNNDLIILAISFGLGLLVGIQREKSIHKVAGVRTFTLIAVLGTVSGFITRDYGNSYFLPVMGLAVTAFFVMANYMKQKKQTTYSIGQTTEVAILLMFAIGAYLVLGSKIIGIIVGGALAVLLYLKEVLHEFVDRLKDKDISAIMTFVGITLVIFPILPDQTYGPYDVLNPRNIWLMVVLIVGISTLGYFVYKWLGKEVGMLSNGVLGGVISSTATTISYARTTKNNKSLAEVSAFVIFSAVTISIIRVVIEVIVVTPQNAMEIIIPFLVLFGFMSVLSVLLFYKASKGTESEKMPEPKNVAQFKSALFFGILYGLILLAVAFTKDTFGQKGLYAVSVIGGLVKKDAITLSLAQSIDSGLDVGLGWRLIMTGVLANFAFKIPMIYVIGDRKLARWVGITLSISVAVGILLIILWP